jgi:integrase
MSLHELSQKELEKRIKDALARGQSITKVADGEGLYLVIRKSGGMSWQLDYTLNGVRKSYSMGTYPKVKLAIARTLAEQAREKVQLGKDPVEERRRERAENQAAKSVSEVLNEWIDHNRHQWSERHRTDYEQAAAANIQSSHGAKKITELTEEDVRAILLKVESRGSHYMLTRVRHVLVRMCQHAVDRRYIPESPATKVQRRQFKAHNEKHFPAVTTPKDLRDLILRLDAEPASTPIAALRLQCLVWVRPQNLRSARWEHVDLDAALWQVPHYLMKKGREYLVPLSTQAVELLRNWKTITGSQELVFPGAKKGMQMSENTLNDNLARMGFSGRQTTHGFRATARTLLEEGGFDSKVTKKQLAHDIDDKVDRAYNRAEYMHVRNDMMQAWADYLDALRVDIQQPWQWFFDWRARRSTHSLPSQAMPTTSPPSQV